METGNCLNQIWLALDDGLKIIVKSMIFLSHNKDDKPIVEPIALTLAKRYGENNIFYDSWPIIPGDSILGKM